MIPITLSHGMTEVQRFFKLKNTARELVKSMSFPLFLFPSVCLTSVFSFTIQFLECSLASDRCKIPKLKMCDFSDLEFFAMLKDGKNFYYFVFICFIL